MPIIDLVKYNGAPDVLAWKYPNENLSSYAQLIVSDCQEAVLFKNGQVLDKFTAGHYVLESYNVPLLTRLMGLPFGGKTPFCVEVWFVNKLHVLDIKWGTSSPILLQDPKYGILLQLRSFGQFGIRILNAETFLCKLVGTLPQFDRHTLTAYFRGVYTTKVKESIASYILNKELSALEINAHLDQISQFIQQQLAPTFLDFGIELVNFYVNDINFANEDISVQSLQLALAKRAEHQILNDVKSANHPNNLPMFCMGCGQSISSASANFCPMCGQKL